MYTFLVIAGPLAASVERASRVRRGLEIVSKLVPTLGSPPAISIEECADAGVTVGTLRPASDYDPSLIQTASDVQWTVVTFGRIEGVNRVAAYVQEAVAQRGLKAVDLIDGNFSAVIVDRAIREVWVCGSVQAQTSLRYATSPDSLLVSPHDVTLVASGLVPVRIDMASVASVAVCDWSLQGQPLLEGVHCAHPLERVCWRSGVVRRHRSAVLEIGDRVDPRDRRGMAEQVDAVAGALEAATQRAVASMEVIHADLTAGMDSRAVWALLASAKRPGQQLRATTRGSAHSLDVVAACELAALTGAEHLREDDPLPWPSGFDSHSCSLAFYMNGDTNAKRAARPPPVVDPVRPRRACGIGGEIFRGFLYRYFGPLSQVPSDPARIVETLSRWRFRRLRTIAFAEPVFSDQVRARVRSTVEWYATVSPDGYDIVDLFYLFERYGRWASFELRNPWSRAWTPFESTEAIRAAYRLPPPIGKMSALHALLVKRHLPARAFRLPVNGGLRLALEGPGLAKDVARQGLNVALTLQKALKPKAQGDSRTYYESVAELVNGALMANVQELLQHPAAVSRELLGPNGVRRLLAEHERHQNQLQLIGLLLTVEQWKRLAVRAEREARAEG